MITIDWPRRVTEYAASTGGPSSSSSKPPRKKPPGKGKGKGGELSDDDKKFIKDNAKSDDDFESKHPRAAAGSAAGGEFIKGGSGGGGDDKKEKQKGAASAKSGSGGGGLDFKAGYDKKGGDSRVKGLQSQLNKMGLTDADGNKLQLDGKLGPKTTAAIKKAQKRLGMKPTGKADAAFLKKLRGSKSDSGSAKSGSGSDRQKPKLPDKNSTKTADVAKLSQARVGRKADGKRPGEKDKPPASKPSRRKGKKSTGTSGLAFREALHPAPYYRRIT